MESRSILFALTCTIVSLFVGSGVAQAGSKYDSPEAAAAIGGHGDNIGATKSSYASKSDKPVVAMNTAAKTAVREDELIETRHEMKLYVDTENQNIQLGRFAVGKFHKAGTFRLVRGSAYARSVQTAMVQTANVMVAYTGTILVSYDFREQTSSVVVIDGTARMYNLHQSDRVLNLKRSQGGEQKIADVYPVRIKDLTQAKINRWLANYHWPKAFRDVFVRQFPEKLTKRHLASNTEVLKDDYKKAKTEELETFFTTIVPGDDDDHPDYYERQYGIVPMKGRKQTEVDRKVEKGEVVSEISPEEAANFTFRPQMTIDLGLPGRDKVVIGSRGVASVDSVKAKKPKAKKRKRRAKRRPASTGVRRLASVVKQVQMTEKRRREDPDVRATLGNLRRVEGERRSEKDYQNGVRPHELIDNLL